MYLVENNKINTDIEIEFIVLPDNYGSTAIKETMNIEIFSHYKDHCQLKFLSETNVMNIMLTLAQFLQIIHSSGHAINDVCYEIKFNIAWKDMLEDVKEKLKYKSIAEMYSFFDIDRNMLYSDDENFIQNIMKILSNN